jgi:hypothetical protein
MIINYLAIICIILTIIIIILIIIKPREKFADIQQPIENPKTKDKIYPSYWYGYFPSDTRSKCFDCDNTSNFEHGTNCFDCEIPGGRQINPLLNRVLTR